MATIREVAELAGVSISTVSHVINETRYVSPSAKARVMDAIQRLNYHHNRLASSLRNQKTHTIGVLLPNNANPFFAKILTGIETACYTSGYNFIMGNANDDPERELSYLRVLLSKQVDGVLLISTGADDAALHLMTERKVPLVLVDRAGTEQADIIHTDNRQGGQLATDYLIRLGHRRIACITGPSFLTPSSERIIGYEQTMQEAGLPVRDEWIITGDFHQESGYQAIQQLLKLDELPTAIFACNDLMALGVLCGLHEAGLSVPDDISLIGYDDIQMASYSVPRLTTIRQPSEELGQLAVERLVERLDNPQAPFQQDVLSVHLITRQSCRLIAEN
ncbi:MAG: LacI family transcriptional regulator [Anaerolineaceae bacterium]|nr:MAG: LacI family transcriptional regulator [Anaerolineaceae bacterium]